MAVQAQNKTPENQKQHSGVAKASLNKSSSVVSSSSASSSDNKRIHPYIHLQKTIGNQAVQQLIKSGKIAPKMDVTHHGRENFKQKADKAADAVLPDRNPANRAKTLVHDNTKRVSKNLTGLNRPTLTLKSNIQRMESNHPLASELIKGHDKEAAKPSTVGTVTHDAIKHYSDQKATTIKQGASPIRTDSRTNNRMSMIPIPPTYSSIAVTNVSGRLPPRLAAPLPLALSGMHLSQNLSPISLRSLAHAQMSSHVSLSTDPAEVEARMVAKKVINMALPQRMNRAIKATGTTTTAATTASRSTAANPQQINNVIHRNLNRQPGVADNIGEVQSKSGGGRGSPLPSKVRSFMEPRFKEDFNQVRIHTGERAAHLSAQLNAQAFTLGTHIFFGKDRFQPDSQKGQELIAHELTHTIQQGATIKRSEDLRVTHHTTPKVQRLGISDVLDYFAEKAYNIPGYRMFTIIIGVNPINMSRVDRSAANILRAVIEFLPGGHLITQALDKYGVFDKVGNWVEEQLKTLGDIGGAFKNALSRFLDSLSWTDIFDLGDVWDRAVRMFTEPVDRIINFAKGLVTGIINFIKDAILMPLAKLAEGKPGWDLLIAVLGKNPITGEPVPRTADTLIGGFMKLIGQEEIWQNMKKAKAIPRAWAWFQGAMKTLLSLVQQFPTLVINTIKSLELTDIILLPRAIAKITGAFGNFFGSFFSWAGGTVLNLLEIIFDVVSPGALRYIKRTGAALKNIFKNPIPFVRNLVKAAKLGFQNFSDKIGKYLKEGLIDWLTGSLQGVYIPKAFELGEIVKFVFSVLGLSWQNVRQKLVAAVGETTVKAMETGFDIVKTLVTQGPAAAWDKIKEQLANLKEMVIKGITDLVVDAVTKKAVPKLLAMFIPGAGFISAIISIYDTVMVFVSKLSKIAQVVTSFVDSIIAIARGDVGGAAKVVESALAGILTLAINFLAGFAGLGKVADKVMGVIGKVRVSVDKGLDALINWIVAMARKIGRFVAQAGVPQDPNTRLTLGMQAAVGIVNRFAGRPVAVAILNPLLSAIKIRYGFQTLIVIPAGKKWSVEGVINPRLILPTQAMQALTGATEQLTLRGPVQDLEQILTRAPFNFNVRSPQGRQSVDSIIANITATGDIGFNYLNILASGRLNAARGFPTMVNQLQNRGMLVTSYSVLLEALRMLEGGIPANRIRFEDTDPTGNYDIDVGILNRRGGYSLITQVKRTTPTGVIRNINDAVASLRGMPASKKRAVIYVSGITYDNYSLTLEYGINNILAAIDPIKVDIVLTDDGGRRLRYPR
jgi:hypothetical protein